MARDDSFCDGYGAGEVDVRNDDVRTFGPEAFGDRAPDAACPAGDEGDAARQRRFRWGEGEFVQLHRPELDAVRIGVAERRVGLNGLGIADDPSTVPVGIGDDARLTSVTADCCNPETRQDHHSRTGVKDCRGRRRRIGGGALVDVSDVLTRPLAPT